MQKLKTHAKEMEDEKKDNKRIFLCAYELVLIIVSLVREKMKNFIIL